MAHKSGADCINATCLGFSVFFLFFQARQSEIKYKQTLCSPVFLETVLTLPPILWPLPRIVS